MSLQFKKKRGLTLVELVLAVLLLNVVILTGLSIELGVRRIFLTTDMEIELLNEAGPILDWIARDINRGIGTATNLPLDTTALPGGGFTYRIRWDSDANGLPNASDIRVAYRWYDTGGNQYQLRYYPNDSVPGTFEVISSRVVNFSIGAISNGVSLVTLQVRLDPASAVSLSNPEIILTTQAQYRSLSIG